MFDFDVEKVLRDNDAKVEWGDRVIDTEGNTRISPHPGYCLIWEHGFIHIGACSKSQARKSAAIFIHLWLNGITAQMADHLIQAYAHIDRYREAVEQYERLLGDIEKFIGERAEMIYNNCRRLEFDIGKSNE